MANNTVSMIKNKINSIGNYNGQLATIQLKTQEAYTLLQFALDNEMIDDFDAEVLFTKLKAEYKEAISSATFENVIKF